jgi:phenylacetate-CoA ligase
VQQFQCVQKSRGIYEVHILPSENEPVSEPEITVNLKKYLGEDASIRFKYVTGIPLLASGKRKIVVNEMA